MLLAGAVRIRRSPPLIDEGLEFDDDNLSPEAAINYYLNDDVSVLPLHTSKASSPAALTTARLPTAALNPAVNGGDFSFLIYESEEAEGFEAGLKGRFLDSALRFNATAFVYEYSDLQVQLFDSTIIQFSTFNASALETYGVEFDAQWNTNIEGLTLRGCLGLDRHLLLQGLHQRNRREPQGRGRFRQRGHHRLHRRIL